MSALVTKFTLHTSSLPQPQFPVAIHLAPTTPSPVDPMPPTHYPAVTHPAAYTSPTAAAAMDTKYAKQTANATRRYGAGGFRGPREISADSGIANMSGNQFCYGSSTEHSSSMDYSPPSSAGAASGGSSSQRRAPSSRPRNLEMVMSSRHKFDVRELDDSLSDESPLAVLPTLPSSFGSGACGQQPAPLSGLTRQQQQHHQHQHVQRPSTAASASLHGTGASNYRKASFASLLDVECIEEEKEFHDKSITEKGTRSGALLGATAAAKEYSPSSKNSSPISSRASWGNAGESMAAKDCSSMSVSSCDSINNREAVCRTLSLDEQDDVDNCSSAVVISGDMLCEYLFSSKSYIIWKLM